MFEFLYDYFFWIIQSFLIVGFFTWFISYVNKKQNYWKEHNVPQIKTKFLIGTDYEFGLYDWPTISLNRSKRYGKFFGGYSLLTPVLTIDDPELIKKILVKDFPHFINRSGLRTYHELLNQNLLFSFDTKWKRMRSIISPSFSTKKLRLMTKIMNYCIDNLINKFNNDIINNKNKNHGEFETKKLISLFTLNVIATTGFNANINNDVNKTYNENDPFFKYSMGLFTTSTLRILAVFLLPKFLLKLLNIRYAFSVESFNYFKNLTEEIIRQRKSNDNNNNKPTDLLQLMLDAEINDDNNQIDDYNDLEQMDFDNENDNNNNNINDKQSSTINNKSKKLTESEIIANAIFFLIAGFETTSSTISHCLYLLAWNQDKQEKLFNELNENLKDIDINSKEYYDKIMFDLPYFQSVIKEALRLYPPVTIITRMVSTDNYKLNDIIPLKRNTTIHIPTHVIHHSEDYYDDPEKFLPERFLPENLEKLIPYTYMPFGLGPRNCIGMRFALQELRLTLSRLLLLYRFDIIDNVTPKKLEFGKRSPLINTSPFKLKIIKR